jgi:DNA polymerase-3 subunit gamma/tau
MRELTSGVNTLPFDSKYKVYILDEVHMLSKSSFNALLKTLEEPPAHVIFILATTELHKVLDTVKSRCQVFEFKKPTIEILSSMIKEGAKKEGFSIDDTAAELIAKRGDGAFRDTWGILERVIQSTKGKSITLDAIETIMATPHHELVTEFIRALVAKNIESALDIVHKIFDDGHSLEHFIENILEHLRLVLLFRFSPQFAGTVSSDLQSDVVTELKKWASEKNIINAGLLVEFIQILGETKKTSLTYLPLELALMRILGTQD